MFCIKICGITNAADAQAAADAGADAIGLNFYHASKRFVSVVVADEICRALPLSVVKIGVFVNSDATEIAEIAAGLNLNGVQLHGDEPPSLLAQLPPGIPVIRAFRCGSAGLSPLGDYLIECNSNGRSPDAILLDADAGQEFGGTGRVADWDLIVRERQLLGNLPVLLGGGLTPENVAAAIDAVRPHGVDVASGVERAPGLKDHDRVRRFVTAAKQGLTKSP